MSAERIDAVIAKLASAIFDSESTARLQEQPDHVVTQFRKRAEALYLSMNVNGLIIRELPS